MREDSRNGGTSLDAADLSAVLMPYDNHLASGFRLLSAPPFLKNTESLALRLCGFARVSFRLLRNLTQSRKGARKGNDFPNLCPVPYKCEAGELDARKSRPVLVLCA
jgi:hypothetical protein